MEVKPMATSLMTMFSMQLTLWITHRLFNMLSLTSNVMHCQLECEIVRN